MEVTSCLEIRPSQDNIYTTYCVAYSNTDQATFLKTLCDVKYTRILLDICVTGKCTLRIEGENYSEGTTNNPDGIDFMLSDLELRLYPETRQKLVHWSDQNDRVNVIKFDDNMQWWEFCRDIHVVEMFTIDRRVNRLTPNLRKENLPELLHKVVYVPHNLFSFGVLQHDYLKQLSQLYEKCEMDGLDSTVQDIRKLITMIFLLNQKPLFQRLLEDDIGLTVIKCLGSALLKNTDIAFTWWISNSNNFRSVVKLPEWLNYVIRKEYRITRLLELLLGVLKETEVSELIQLRKKYRKDILNCVMEPSLNVLEALFEELTNLDVEDSRKHDLMLFLKEFCCMGYSEELKPAQMRLFQADALNALAKSFEVQNEESLLASAYILDQLAELDVWLLRERCILRSELQENLIGILMRKIGIGIPISSKVKTEFAYLLVKLCRDYDTFSECFDLSQLIEDKFPYLIEPFLRVSCDDLPHITHDVYVEAFESPLSLLTCWLDSCSQMSDIIANSIARCKGVLICRFIALLKSPYKVIQIGVLDIIKSLLKVAKTHNFVSQELIRTKWFDPLLHILKNNRYDAVYSKIMGILNDLRTFKLEELAKDVFESYNTDCLVKIHVIIRDLMESCEGSLLEKQNRRMLEVPEKVKPKKSKMYSDFLDIPLFEPQGCVSKSNPTVCLLSAVQLDRQPPYTESYDMDTD